MKKSKIMDNIFNQYHLIKKYHWKKKTNQFFFPLQFFIKMCLWLWLCCVHLHSCSHRQPLLSLAERTKSLFTRAPEDTTSHKPVDVCMESSLCSSVSPSSQCPDIPTMVIGLFLIPWWPWLPYLEVKAIFPVSGVSCASVILTQVPVCFNLLPGCSLRAKWTVSQWLPAQGPM